MPESILIADDHPIFRRGLREVLAERDDYEVVAEAGNGVEALRLIREVHPRIALLDKKARPEIEDVVRRIEKIETAVEPNFQEHFVLAMAIPHKTHEFPNLAKVVTLPAPKTSGSQGAGDGAGDGAGRGRRSRRRARPS